MLKSAFADGDAFGLGMVYSALSFFDCGVGKMLSFIGIGNRYRVS